MRRISLALSVIAALLGCGGGGLTPGSGPPFSPTLANLPSGTEFAASFQLMTPISGVELIGAISNPVSVPCSDGGTAETTAEINASAMDRYTATYNACAGTLWLGTNLLSETVQGSIVLIQNVNGTHQVTALSLSGGLGLAIDCDVTTNVPAETTGHCKVFDAEGTTVDIELDLAALMI